MPRSSMTIDVSERAFRHALHAAAALFTGNRRDARCRLDSDVSSQLQSGSL